MRKFVFLVSILLIAASAFAEYTVVLKDGRRFAAKEKWKIVDGKAIVTLTNGTTIQIDPSAIDAAQSEAVTRSGLGDAKVLQTAPQNDTSRPQPKSSLGTLATIRRPQQDSGAASGTPTRASGGTGRIDAEVSSKFGAAFENVGLYDAKLSPASPGQLRIDVTADNEDQVFKAISATSFIFANVPSEYSIVELFMRTTIGGSAGRFQMTKDDARALANKQMDWTDYYLNKVIF